MRCVRVVLVSRGSLVAAARMVVSFQVTRWFSVPRGDDEWIMDGLTFYVEIYQRH